MSDNPKLSLYAQADTGLASFVRSLLSGIKQLALWMLGLIGIVAYFDMIFEYGEGLADIALHEWGFMLLALALTWRHCRYVRYFGYGLWLGLGRWLTALGLLFAFELAALGIMVWLSVELTGNTEVLDSLKLASKEEEIIDLAFGLLALYLAAPTQPRIAERHQPVAVNARYAQPNDSSTPDKAANL